MVDPSTVLVVGVEDPQGITIEQRLAGS